MFVNAIILISLNHLPFEPLLNEACRKQKRKLDNRNQCMAHWFRLRVPFFNAAETFCYTRCRARESRLSRLAAAAGDETMAEHRAKKCVIKVSMNRSPELICADFHGKWLKKNKRTPSNNNRLTPLRFGNASKIMTVIFARAQVTNNSRVGPNVSADALCCCAIAAKTDDKYFECFTSVSEWF